MRPKVRICLFSDLFWMLQSYSYVCVRMSCSVAFKWRSEGIFILRMRLEEANDLSSTAGFYLTIPANWSCQTVCRAKRHCTNSDISKRWLKAEHMYVQVAERMKGNRFFSESKCSEMGQWLVKVVLTLTVFCTRKGQNLSSQLVARRTRQWHFLLLSFIFWQSILEIVYFLR